MAMDTYSEVPLTMVTADRLEPGLMYACTRAVMHSRLAWPYRTDTPWTAWATATPLRDIKAARTVVGLSDPSREELFDGDALVYVNRSTLYHLLKNANDNDLWGQRNVTCATGAAHPVNSVLRGLNLPQVAVYDRGYLFPVDEGALHLFIPDGVALMIDKTFTHIVKMVVF